MTDLLLITDVPRLRKIFSRLSGERDFRLRIATSLERGVEELLAEKPAVIFVQTHLSGLSPEILLMHLKKQLGRRRSRFVLLCPAAQLSAEATRQYHGHLDTALEDHPLFDQLRELLSQLAAPRPRKTAAAPVAEPLPTPISAPEPPMAMAPAHPDAAAVSSSPDLIRLSAPLQQPVPEPLPPQAEKSLEEQGVVYSPRSGVSVYSEFTSSFDNHVRSMPAADEAPQAVPLQEWQTAQTELGPPASDSRSMKMSFLLWLAPVLVAVVAVTFFQHRKTTAPKVDVAVAPQAVPVSPPPAPTATAAAPLAAAGPAAAPAAPIAAQPVTVPAPVPASAPAPAPVAKAPAPAAKSPAVSPTAAEKVAASPKAAPAVSAPAAATVKGPVKLPDFVPRYGYDKKYGAANPGWERYKGAVTEFKIYREGNAIKAIQVIDRGGNGVPESFMKGVLRQLAAKPSFNPATSEKKDGYQIQRGMVAENLQGVFYRDAEGGKLRAFVVTWQ